jgi:hypothetical protein
MLKNYTSTVAVSRSVQHIEDRLVRFGAHSIMKTYDAKKRIEAFCFIVSIQGKEIPFKLPAKVQNVEVVLKGQIRRSPTAAKLQSIIDQAERTAWKLVSDWVDIQLSLVELGQVELLEVLLSYVYSPAKKETFFERIQGNGFKLLEMK